MAEAGTVVFQLKCEPGWEYLNHNEGTTNEVNAESDHLESCCLCTDGIKLRNALIEHLGRSLLGLCKH